MVAATKSTLAIRTARVEDVPRLAQLNHAAYPDLVEEGVVWSEEQLHVHLARFPEGQLVAELDGAPAGAVSTLIVPRKRDPLAQHTWREMTDDGLLTSHDPGGSTLYLVDIYVDPAAWGRGVGPTLYAGLRGLCAQFGLRRIVAGGRLWSYHEYAGRMWPEEYVQRVIDGELHDRVLSSQLRAGYRVRGILDEYLQDPRSCNYATLLEWTRPAD
jgi:ribosomal protein S18 acetylase RimI-like enzyme